MLVFKRTHVYSHASMNTPRDITRVAQVTFKVGDLGLNPTQKHKFLLLTGQHYDKETDKVTLSSDRFPLHAQNERFLRDTLHRLLRESKVAAHILANAPLMGFAGHEGRLYGRSNELQNHYAKEVWNPHSQSMDRQKGLYFGFGRSQRGFTFAFLDKPIRRGVRGRMLLDNKEEFVLLGVVDVGVKPLLLAAIDAAGLWARDACLTAGLAVAFAAGFFDAAGVFFVF